MTKTNANAHAMAARDRTTRRARAKRSPRALAVASASAPRSALPGRKLGPALTVDERCGTGRISAEFIGLVSVEWNGVEFADWNGVPPSSARCSPGAARAEAFADSSCESSRQAGSLFHAADATRTLAAAAAESMRTKRAVGSSVRTIRLGRSAGNAQEGDTPIQLINTPTNTVTKLMSFPAVAPTGVVVAVLRANRFAMSLSS